MKSKNIAKSDLLAKQKYTLRQVRQAVQLRIGQWKLLCFICLF
jgi:hypothetical protein